MSAEVLAPHYARALIRGCGAHAAYMRSASRGDAEAISELLPGEDFAVLEYAGGWAWGHSLQGRLVGYVEAVALAARTEATHVVCEPMAPVTADSAVAALPLAHLPMGARLYGAASGASLATEYGFVALSHLRPIEEHEDDAPSVAERLFGALFLRGGRTLAGIDAAGLVQLSLSLCGIEAPRLAGHYAEFGDAVAGPARRGDIVLFEGGLGLMVDDLMLIEASEARGRVTLTPLAETREPRLRRLPG